ncbi:MULTISPECIES: ribosome maturation factor RimP [Candidatus Ichthyocystis]|uniref:ribosome maturation factor RimP n=1 Tax=Candidatus Ichthyocystis TaxID=2929841 RepID=UPI000A86619A|nr:MULTISPECIES: ribosome maturation factor RimP [Ichthyocystis]
MCYNPLPLALLGLFSSVLLMDDFLPWLEMTLSGLGYELVDFELSPGGLIRLFIDHKNGVSIGDCARVSRHLSKAFAVKGVEYDNLEVSSPGLNRALKKAADFDRFKNHEVKVVLSQPIVVGDLVFSKTVVGLLLAFDQAKNEMTFLVNDCEVTLSLDKTRKVCLVSKF